MSLIRTAILLILFLTNGIMEAQKEITPNQLMTDSLWEIWSDLNEDDTIRLKALHSIGWYGFLNTNPDSAFSIAKIEYDFAEKKGLKKQMAFANNTMGASFYIKGDYTNSIKYYTESVEIGEKLKDNRIISPALNNLGIVYYKQGDFIQAVSNYTKSLKIHEENGNPSGIATALNNIGNLYNVQGDNEKAIEYHKSSLKIEEERGDKQGIAASLNNIGSIYLEQEKYDLALAYFTRSLKYGESINSRPDIATSMINIGIIYSNQGNFDEALEFTKGSLKIYEEIDYRLGSSISMNQLGSLHFKTGNYQGAIDYSIKGLEIAQDLGTVVEIRNAAGNLYKAYKKNGNIDLSYKMYELYIEMRDSIEDKESQKEIIRQEINYAYEKHAIADSLAYIQQTALSQQASTNQRNGLLAGFIVALILIGIFFRFRFVRNQSEKKELIQEIKLLKAETIVKKALSLTLTDQPQLNKEKLEAVIDSPLNQSDWRILNTLYENPAISNKELSEKVVLSVEGTRSSLAKMYRSFNIKTARNQRFVLVVEATKISNAS